MQMKNFFRHQMVQAWVMLIVFLLQHEPAEKLPVAVLTAVTIGILAAVGLTAKETVQRGTQMVALSSVALISGLGLLAVHLDKSWLLLLCLTALAAISYITYVFLSSAAPSYRPKWAPAASIVAQGAVIGVGMYLITFAP